MAGSVSTLGLGANLGSPPAMLSLALRQLRSWSACSHWQVSSLYRGPYFGPGPAQPDYWNAVVRFECSLAAEDVLRHALALQAELDPTPRRRNEPRRLDLDLLLHGDRCSQIAELTLPHPRLRSRRFVLQPLHELAPRLSLPDDGCTIAELLSSPQVQAQRLEVMVSGEWWNGRALQCAT